MAKNVNTLIPNLHSTGIKYDLLGFCETWLKPSNVDCYGIQGYTHEYLTTDDRAGGS
jgi:hypothetical protein